MAFTTRRGRPPSARREEDLGTPETRLKHALRFTAEPIDLCLEREIISREHHWCGLHLRWLYTLRYGAPNLTSAYATMRDGAYEAKLEDEAWRAMREREYHEAAQLLKARRRYECVMRLAVFNERPAFLNPAMQARSSQQPALAHALEQLRGEIRDGLDLLAHQWQRRS